MTWHSVVIPARNKANLSETGESQVKGSSCNLWATPWPEYFLWCWRTVWSLWLFLQGGVLVIPLQLYPIISHSHLNIAVVYSVTGIQSPVQYNKGKENRIPQWHLRKAIYYFKWSKGKIPHADTNMQQLQY